MKKLLVTLTTLAVLTMSLLAVSASEVTEEVVVTTNMDAATYLELRTAQLDEALAEGTITADQYALLLAHITDNSTDGLFGNGPQGYLDNEDKECVLGEDGNLGIFRNENSGQQLGNGNGMTYKDGTGNGSRNKGNGQNGSGKQASRANSGTNGMRLQDGSAENEDCIID